MQSRSLLCPAPVAWSDRVSLGCRPIEGLRRLRLEPLRADRVPRRPWTPAGAAGPTICRWRAAAPEPEPPPEFEAGTTGSQGGTCGEDTDKGRTEPWRDALDVHSTPQTGSCTQQEDAAPPATRYRSSGRPNRPVIDVQAPERHGDTDLQLRPPPGERPQ